MESTSIFNSTVYADESFDEQKRPKVPALTDWIFRLIKTKTDLGDQYEISKLETATFVNGITKLCANSQILTLALKNLWRNNKYNQEYISYLLGSYSKEEFKEIAKEFAVPLNDKVYNAEFISSASRVICSAVNQSISSDEIALLLNVTPSSIENSLKKLASSSEQEESD